jgi:hypothetical protein
MEVSLNDCLYLYDLTTAPLRVAEAAKKDYFCAVHNVLATFTRRVLRITGDAVVIH